MLVACQSDSLAAESRIIQKIQKQIHIMNLQYRWYRTEMYNGYYYYF